MPIISSLHDEFPFLNIVSCSVNSYISILLVIPCSALTLSKLQFRRGCWSETVIGACDWMLNGASELTVVCTQ